VRDAPRRGAASKTYLFAESANFDFAERLASDEALDPLVRFLMRQLGGAERGRCHSARHPMHIQYRVSDVNHTSDQPLAVRKTGEKKNHDKKKKKKKKKKKDKRGKQKTALSNAIRQQFILSWRRQEREQKQNFQ
jgi:hypothetical protein